MARSSASMSRQRVRDFGYCLNFSGGSATDRVVVANSASSQAITTNFSITTWAIFTAYTPVAARFFQKHDQFNHGFIFLINGTTKTIRVQLDGTLYESAIQNILPLLGVWTHFGVTFDSAAGSDQIKFYMNGVAAGVATRASAITSHTDSIYLGNRDTPYDRCFPGALDEQKLFNRTLSAQEMLSESIGTLTSTTGLIGYWKYNEGSGTTAIDSTGTHSDGTITGATYTTNVAFKSRTLVS